MVNSKQVPLSEAYWFQEGPGVRNWQFTTSGVKLLNVGNITKDGNIDLDKTDKHISLDEAEGKYSHFLVDEGDLVIASSGISFDEDGMLRTRGAFIEKKHLPLCLNTSTIRFKAIDGVSDLNFFKFWLDSFEFRNQVSRLVTGSAQQNFGPSHLKAINIFLPPLTEQKRIASLLRRVDRLRTLRRTAHELGESLLQSVFLEMFGNPVTNPKNWDVKEIQEVVINHDSKRIPLEESVRAKRQGIYPYYGATGIIDYLDDYIFDEDMLLIAEDGKNLLNRTKPLAFMAYGKYWVNNHSHVVSSAGQINLRYLEAALNIRDISAYVTGIDQFKLNRANLDVIPIHVPPLSLQEEFAGVVARVESLRGRMSEAGRQVEGLFESLLSESFGG